jgi:predicted ribosome quality control (RQC) complex YloA/Tae2 family protein
VLNRHVLEVNKLLSSYTLIEIFTQEKNKLIFYLRRDVQDYFIELNADSSLPYFIVREKYNRAKKNTLDFFKSYLPSKLNSINIAELDRIIQFKLQAASIYFYIHGKETNIFLIDDEKNFLSFKKTENAQNLVEEMYKISFTQKFQIPELNLEMDDASFKSILKSYPYLGKEIVDELEIRYKNKIADNKGIILQNILREMESQKPFVYLDDSTGKFKLSFFIRQEFQPEKPTFFESVNDALKFLLVQKQKHQHENIIGREIKSRYEKKIIQLEKKRDHLQSRISEGCKDQKYQRIANLLMLNINQIQQGMTKIELEDVYDSNKVISIDLLPKLNPRENVNYYFDKAKAERKEFDKLSSLLYDVNEEIKKQKKLFEEEKMTEPEENQLFSSKALIQKKGEKQSLQMVKIKFRQFILYDKYLIFVGKNSKNNDELTTEFAKQNDYWFHARSVSGSHVVLRYDKSQGEIQKNILEKAAAIAAFYSKAKTSGLVPVSYTQKKYVIKRKGMEPGKVYLLKEKVLIVKPEIPKECKLITEV